MFRLPSPLEERVEEPAVELAAGVVALVEIRAVLELVWNRLRALEDGTGGLTSAGAPRREEVT